MLWDAPRSESDPEPAFRRDWGGDRPAEGAQISISRRRSGGSKRPSESAICHPLTMAVGRRCSDASGLLMFNVQRAVLLVFSESLYVYLAPVIDKVVHLR